LPSNSIGKIRAVSVAAVTNISYGPWASKPTWSINDKLDKANTYVNVFGPHQQEQLNLLLKQKKINVLYKSKKACNTVHRQYFRDWEWDWNGSQIPLTKRQIKEDHGRNRNTVVVWEFKE
jgi:hypothetical protein